MLQLLTSSSSTPVETNCFTSPPQYLAGLRAAARASASATNKLKPRLAVRSMFRFASGLDIGIHHECTGCKSQNKRIHRRAEATASSVTVTPTDIDKREATRIQFTATILATAGMLYGVIIEFDSGRHLARALVHKPHMDLTSL
jgi:hypothetical protein